MEIIKCKNNYGEDVEIEKSKFVFRPSAYAITIKNNKILGITLKSSGKLWLPGGGINCCESIHDALKREVLEETGLHLTNIAELLLVKENLLYCKIEGDAFHIIAHFYLCEIEDAEEYSLAPGDDDLNAASLDWFTLEEVKKIGFHDLHEDLIEVLEKILK